MAGGCFPWLYVFVCHWFGDGLALLGSGPLFDFFASFGGGSPKGGLLALSLPFAFLLLGGCLIFVVYSFGRNP